MYEFAELAPLAGCILLYCNLAIYATISHIDPALGNMQ